MFNKLTYHLAYDLNETVIALEQIIEQCGGPETNNPNRLDLAALERVKRLIDQISTETETTETGGIDGKTENMLRELR